MTAKECTALETMCRENAARCRDEAEPRFARFEMKEADAWAGMAKDWDLVAHRWAELAITIGTKGIWKRF